MEFGFTTAAYVVAAVLFILVLAACQGRKARNALYGMALSGMALAVAATLLAPVPAIGCCR